ncbi:flagellar FlbD family protein [Gracilibacillus marinus]|jgi:flagellar protein FlbD|uniref:Flagellar FlbD family protein n=1 Tax=Gracilibacillus marinus TaxID=630535 RepID=A0ABV8VTS2_9BACI
MITLTNLTGSSFTLNALYIEKIESLPDTTITLINNKKYFVKENEEVVVKRTIEYYQQIGLTHLQRGIGETNES